MARIIRQSVLHHLAFYARLSEPAVTQTQQDAVGPACPP